MKERLEKAIEVLNLDGFCEDVNCEDCPLSPNCLIVIATENLFQAINDMGEQPKIRDFKVRKDNKNELNEESLRKKWKKREYNLPCLLNIDNPTNKIIDEVLKKHLPKGLTFLEIGCNLGRWMIYFDKEFKYRVSGCDIKGLEKTKENLRLNEVEGNVFYKDIKNKDQKIGKYNIVFSEGLIEHFSNPKEIFDNHIELSNKYVVILVPNLTTYNYDKETHTIITINDLKEWSRNLDVLFLGYIGGREPRTMHWDKHHFMNRYIKPLLIKIWSCFKFKESNKSPYIMLIAKK